MKPEDPGWYESIQLLDARDWIDKARKHLDEEMPGMAFIDACVAVEKITKSIRGINSAAIRVMCTRAIQDNTEFMRQEGGCCKHIFAEHKKGPDGEYHCTYFQCDCKKWSEL